MLKVIFLVSKGLRMRRGFIVVTGDPGSGKTTLILKVARKIMSLGYSVGGCVTREIRSNGVRTGFEVLNLSDGSTGILASVNIESGPRVGKYRVNLLDLQGIGARAIEEALEKSELIVIDEVGPMELLSPEFKKELRKLLDGEKPVIAAVHKYAKDDIIKEMKEKADFIFQVEKDNREKLADEIFMILEQILKRRNGE
jgi:nucleoside-triphosphatase